VAVDVHDVHEQQTKLGPLDQPRAVLVRRLVCPVRQPWSATEPARKVGGEGRAEGTYRMSAGLASKRGQSSATDCSTSDSDSAPLLWTSQRSNSSFRSARPGSISPGPRAGSDFVGFGPFGLGGLRFPFGDRCCAFSFCAAPTRSEASVSSGLSSFGQDPTSAFSGSATAATAAVSAALQQTNGVRTADCAASAHMKASFALTPPSSATRPSRAW